MAVTMTFRWDDAGTLIPVGQAKYVVNEQPIAEYDNWALYTLAADMQAVIDDVINKFNANTILKADTDNTPAALTVGTNTIVGRAAGSISALTASEVRTLISVENGADVTDSTNVNAAGAVMESDFNATTFLYATSDNAPQPKTPSEVRATLNVENGATADQTGGEIKSAYEAEVNAYTDTKNTKLTGIATGADVTADNPPQAHGASVHTDRTRKIWAGSPHKYTGGMEFYGISLDPSTDEEIMYSFVVPNDFVSVSGVYVYYAVNSAGGNIVLDINTMYGSASEAPGIHTDSDTGNVIATPTATTRHAFSTSGLLSSVSVTDVVTVHVKRDADHGSDTNVGDAVISGVLVEYTADM